MRISALDTLRGISICLVLTSHFCVRLVDGLYDFQNHIFNFGVTGVFVFFCVSGYVIPLTIRRGLVGDGRFCRLAQFWIKRAFRLLPVYLVLIAPAWFLLVLPDEQRHQAILALQSQEPVQYATALITFTGFFFRYPLPFGGLEWSLAYEVVFYGCCSATILAALPLGRWSLVAGTMALFVTVFVPVLPYDAQQAAFMLLFFYLGLLTFAFHSKHLERKEFAILSAVILTLIYGRALMWASQWGVSFITGAAVVGPIIFLVGTLTSRLERVGPAFAPLGVLSYSLYLSHMLVIEAVALPNAPGPFRFLVWLAVSILLSFLLFRLWETPLNLLGHRLSGVVSARCARPQALQPPNS